MFPGTQAIQPVRPEAAMRKWLAEGEYVIVQTRQHGRTLFRPAAMAVLVPLATFFVLGWLSRGNLGKVFAQVDQWTQPLMMLVGVAAVVLFLSLTVRGFVQWRGRQYILTSRRIVQQRGVLQRHRQDFPLAAVRHVATHQSGIQRVFRSGTISLDMGLDGQGALHEVPEVAKFRSLVLEAINALPKVEWAQGPGPEAFGVGDSWQT